MERSKVDLIISGIGVSQQHRLRAQDVMLPEYGVPQQRGMRAQDVVPPEDDLSQHQNIVREVGLQRAQDSINSQGKTAVSELVLSQQNYRIGENMVTIDTERELRVKQQGIESLSRNLLSNIIALTSTEEQDIARNLIASLNKGLALKTFTGDSSGIEKMFIDKLPQQVRKDGEIRNIIHTRFEQFIRSVHDDIEQLKGDDQTKIKSLEEDLKFQIAISTIQSILENAYEHRIASQIGTSFVKQLEFKEIELSDTITLIDTDEKLINSLHTWALKIIRGETTSFCPIDVNSHTQLTKVISFFQIIPQVLQEEKDIVICWIARDQQRSPVRLPFNRTLITIYIGFSLSLFTDEYTQQRPHLFNCFKVMNSQIFPMDAVLCQDRHLWVHLLSINQLKDKIPHWFRLRFSFSELTKATAMHFLDQWTIFQVLNISRSTIAVKKKERVTQAYSQFAGSPFKKITRDAQGTQALQVAPGLQAMQAPPFPLGIQDQIAVQAPPIPLHTHNQQKAPVQLNQQAIQVQNQQTIQAQGQMAQQDIQKRRRNSNHRKRDRRARSRSSEIDNGELELKETKNEVLKSLKGTAEKTSN